MQVGDKVTVELIGEIIEIKKGYNGKLSYRIETANGAEFVVVQQSSIVALTKGGN